MDSEKPILLHFAESHALKEPDDIAYDDARQVATGPNRLTATSTTSHRRGTSVEDD